MTPRLASVFLLTAFVSGAVAVVAAMLAQPPSVGLVARLFEAAGMLAFSVPALPPQEPPLALAQPALAVAQMAAVVFGLTAVLGAALELFPSVRDRVRRIWFGGLRWARQRPAVVLGLGWVGGPLARQIRAAGRPVYAAAIDGTSPRAAAARRDGALVVVGDASDPAVRARLALGHAREVFIATGDDARNVQIAGDLMTDAAEGRLGAAPTRAFVHVDDPSLRAAVRRAGLLRTPPESGLEVEVFAASELAARQLHYHPAYGLARTGGLCPAKGEVPHVLVFGFGALGRTVVLEAARSLHFAGGLRPRITVFGRDPAAWQAFLERHPGLAPPGLDLASDAFFAPADPDAWATRAGRPADPHHWADAWACVDGDEVVETGGRRVRPVEYAAHAEFVALSGDVVSVEVVAAVQARLAPGRGRGVAAAAVVCLEDERQAVEAALRLRRALHDRLGAPADEAPPVLPLYVHLPTEAGLAAVIAPDGQPQEGTPPDALGLASRFPLRPFGKQTEVMSVADVTGEDVRRRAAWIRASHGQVRGAAAHRHADFDDSDKAAGAFLPVRLDAVRACYPSPPLQPDRALAEGFEERPLLAALMAPEVLRHPEYARLEAAAGGRISVGALPPALPEALRDGTPLDPDPVAADCLERLYERLALLSRFGLPPASEPGEHTRWKAMVDTLQRRAVDRLDQEIRDAGRDPDVMARMEHNRWMGERLVKGWRFGSKSNPRRTRTTIVPCEDLEPDQLLYDRIQLARVLIEDGRAFAPADPRAPVEVAYLRRAGGGA